MRLRLAVSIPNEPRQRSMDTITQRRAAEMNVLHAGSQPSAKGPDDYFVFRLLTAR